MKTNKILLFSTIVLSIICLSLIGILIFQSLRPTLTIVFYDTEYIEEETASNDKEQYVCAYIRLNTEKNYKLNVQDFSIFCYDKGYKKATKAEYFNQTVNVEFYTYPNQPTLKLYFKIPPDDASPVIFIKYKNTEMQIGEFATIH